MERGNLILIHGGKKPGDVVSQGPISRMNLWERGQAPVPARLLAFVLFAKVALLASILYYFFG